MAAVAPVLAFVLAAGAGIALAFGDQRVGVFPWLVAGGAACLAVCCLGLIAVHAPGQSTVLLIGGGWAASAFLGLAGAFVAIGFGDVAGIADSVTGPVAAVPVILAGFGFLSMAPALLVFGFGAKKADRLPSWGVWAVWFVALMVPLTLFLAGSVPDDLKNVVPGVMLALLSAGWIVVGVAINSSGRK